MGSDYRAGTSVMQWAGLIDHLKIAADDLQSIYYNYLISNGVSENNIICIFSDDTDYEEYCNPHVPIGLYGVLNSLIRKSNVDVYVTRSNSKFLSSDVMTEFRGRGDEIHICSAERNDSAGERCKISKA